MRRLGILEGGLDHADVIGNVAIDREKIELTVQIVVKEKCAEGERLGRNPWQCRSRELRP